MLAILCILFIIVIPMAMLPGGLKTLGMWIKLILWVESWPVFYAIINSVALIMASNRGAAYISTGAGLSLLTQNGLADAAYDAYCYAEGFMAIVPVMSWAVISGGGYALANLSSTVTRSVDGLSSKLGSEMTDGTLSFDNQNYHNMSVGGYQLAQQQLGSSINYAQRYDDGHMITTFDSLGHAIIQENQTQLKTNVSGTDNVVASLSETAQQSWQAAQHHSQMAANSWHQGLNELASFAYQHSKSAGTNDTFGQTQSAGVNQDFRQAWDTAQKISHQTGLSTDRAFKAGINLSVGTGGLLGRVFNMSVSGDGHMTASEREDMNKVSDTGLHHQLSENLSRGLQHSFSHQGLLAHQEQRQAVDSIQESFNSAKNYQEQANASVTESENFNRAATLAQSNSFASTTNWNHQVLSDLADRQFDGNVQQAAQWQSTNSEAYATEAALFMQKKQQALIQSLRSNHALSEGQIRDRFNQYQRQVPSLPDQGMKIQVRDVINQQGLGHQEERNIHQETRYLRQQMNQALGHSDRAMAQGQADIGQGQQHLQDHYQTESGKGMLKRLGENFNKTAEPMNHLTTPPVRVETTQEMASRMTSQTLSHDAYDLAHQKSKMAAQGRELKQLRQFMENRHDRPSYEDVLPTPPRSLD